jgi:hypothetical protein
MLLKGERLAVCQVALFSELLMATWHMPPVIGEKPNTNILGASHNTRDYGSSHDLATRRPKHAAIDS